MEKEDNFTAAAMNSGLVEMDYSTAANNQHHQLLMMNNPPFSAAQHDHYGSSSMTFGDVMQFADFGPRLALQHQSQTHENEDGDGNYMLKFPVLNDLHTSNTQENHDHYYHDDQSHQENNDGTEEPVVQLEFLGASGSLNQMMMISTSGNANSSEQVMVNHDNSNNGKSNNNNNSKRKRARALKTTEEVESQRMTHIAVERNRRKQMNEHLRVLRTLMPSSYVQRGDQASIIGGAIEFVRELEQLLQCLESQKRRRLYGEAAPSGVALPIESNQPFGTNNATTSNGNEDNQAMVPNKLVDLDNTMIMGNLGGLQEETAESKSSIADVEVKLLGFDAFIKILSRRRPSQLIKAISALQDLQFNILHTNITTIEQTVLYSFNVQISSDTRFSAEDIASSVQQIFTFIHASTAM